MDAEAHKELLSALNARRNGLPERIELAERDLRGLYAPGADLVGADLRGARLHAACLAGARLARANLAGADLVGCDLAGADLTDADLRGADLTDALLDDAVLTNVALQGACVAGVLGDPLSMAFARMDRATIERSGLSDGDVARFASRGVDFEAPAESVAPSLRPSLEQRPLSLAHSLRPLEVSARQQIAIQDELQMPASLRAFKELSALIEEATRRASGRPPASDEDVADEKLAPLSLAPPAPVAAPEQIDPFRLPQVGDEYLGVTIQRQLPGGTVTATFLGVNEEGEPVIVRVFNPTCPSAALQLPAFQRGVRALNRVQGLDEPALRVVEVLAVATDMTGYLVKYYEDGCLEDLGELGISLTGKLELFRSICAAVGVLHRQGLLLRCLKPRNILVEGLSPVLSEIDMVDLPSLRQASRDLFGYAPYAAPEEVVGQGTRSPTADVFALGQLLRYLLGGPEHRLQGRGIPRALLELIDRATATDPASRYQYVEELLKDLDRFTTQGANAVLGVSLRPAAVSRISAPRLTAPRSGPAEARQVRSARAELDVGGDGSWLPRWMELVAASLGALVGLSALALVWMRPAISFDVASAGPLLAAIVGLSAWFLPGFAPRPALFRWGTWSLLAALVFFVDVRMLASLRWRLDLRGGSTERKEEAVYGLARLGKRDFSGALLEELRLRSRDLGSVSFRGASLRGSDLSNSFLMEADFTGADLSEANFRDADLRGAELDLALHLEQAQCSRRTLLPTGFQCRHGFIARTTP